MKAVIIATLNKSSERWSDEDVSALLAIYSEDVIQKLLLKAVSVVRPGNRPQRKVMPGRLDDEGKINYSTCTALF